MYRSGHSVPMITTGPGAFSSARTTAAGQPVLAVQVALQLIQPHHRPRRRRLPPARRPRPGPAGCTSHQSGSSAFTASTAQRVFPTDDPPTSSTNPPRCAAAATLARTPCSAVIHIPRHVLRRDLLRHPRHADRRMHPQPPRIGLADPHRPCRWSDVPGRASRVGRRCRRGDAEGNQPCEHVFDPLSLQVGQVMVELVGQRRQRPAARSAEHDLPHQVAGQLLRQHGAWHSQNLRRRLPGASPAGIIQHGQLSRYPRLQHFQHRHRPGQRRILHGLAEGFPDHHRELPGLLSR